MCLTWATVPTVGAGVLVGWARPSRRAREACGCVLGPARGSPGAPGGGPQPWAGSLSTPFLSPAFRKEQGALGGHARGAETPAWRGGGFPRTPGPEPEGQSRHKAGIAHFPGGGGGSLVAGVLP